ncbi:MAG: type 1 glutamine amidotransferase [Deltaproteobacteria bacterium]|nr:type 1 glutamine amidotransferase [Deltaproteobacteria bacterium]
MEKRVLILDGCIYPEFYHPVREWRSLLEDVPSDSVHLPSGEPVPDIEPYSHVIVGGSEASIAVPELWFEAEVTAIRRACELGKPILGSCFGHQALAMALTGEQHVGPSPTPELGWVPVRVTASDELFDGLPNPLWVFVSHFDEVRDPPPPWRVLARSDGCAVQAMRYGDRPIWGIQAHPEITPDDGRELLEGFLVKAPDRAELIHTALAQTPRDDGLALALTRRFLSF